MEDFTLPHINWEECTARIADQQCFVDSLTQDWSLEQIIRTPTNRKGNNLDLVFVTHSDAYEYEIMFSRFPPQPCFSKLQF